MWDARSGGSLRSLKGDTDSVLSVAFSPDGNTIVSGSQDGTIRLWDSRSGKNTKTLTGHTDWVLSVAFSPDGNTIASGGGDFASYKSDNTVRLWDARSGDSLQVLEGHTGMVSYVAFSPNGLTLASASWDGTVLLWGSSMITTTWGKIKQSPAVEDTKHLSESTLSAGMLTLTETKLLSNYPNPFNPETWIPYDLKEPAEVMLSIYEWAKG